jgi:DNA-binding PucR family transcriptional regulator
VKKRSRRVFRLLEQIEALPAHQQTTLLKTIDTFLKGHHQVVDTADRVGGTPL